MAAPPDDVPRWQPPATEPQSETWEPSAGVPRWDPDAATPRQPPPGRVVVGARIETERAERRAPVQAVPLVKRPFLWWAAHPWVFAWAGVILVPVGVVLLRFVDEYASEDLVEPLQWALLALLAVLLGRAVLFSARRSVTRLLLGLGGAVVTVLLLLWPLTQVTLGRVMCPPRAGTNLGVTAAATAVEAWARGEAGDAAWRGGQADPAWRAKVQAMSLLDHQLVESGCFERMAPTETHHTWHDFRVTVKEGERAPLSKVLTVRTTIEDGTWKISGIEGPLP